MSHETRMGCCFKGVACWSSWQRLEEREREREREVLASEYEQTEREEVCV